MNSLVYIFGIFTSCIFCALGLKCLDPFVNMGALVASGILIGATHFVLVAVALYRQSVMLQERKQKSCTHESYYSWGICKGCGKYEKNKDELRD